VVQYSSVTNGDLFYAYNKQLNGRALTCTARGTRGSLAPLRLVVLPKASRRPAAVQILPEYGTVTHWVMAFGTTDDMQADKRQSGHWI
jgi:hypothetical protein